MNTDAIRLELLWGDVRAAWRNALRRPAFTALVVATLALGIGVNSAAFALLDGVLLRALPYREPSRLVFVWQTLPEHNVLELQPTPFDYAAWRTMRSLSAVGLVSSDSYTLSGDDNPERVRGARMTASVLTLLGVSPQLGRSFAPSEDAETSAPVVILGHRLWRRRFGADADVLGRGVRIDGVMHTVIGVMPERASLPGPLAEDDELWLPARMNAAERDNAVSHNYSVLARLSNGVSLAGAAAELDAFAKRMAVERPLSHRGLGARLVSIDEQTSRGVRPALLVIAGGVALLLLVACANAATLLIARASSRRHEMAIRAALGASDARLFRLAVIESLVFAALGGIAGLILGGWSLRAMLPLLAGSVPSSAPIEVGVRVMLFTVAVSGALALSLGLVAAAHNRGAVSDALRLSARTATSGRAFARARGVLVVTQVALAVVLLAASGLMLRSVVKLSRVNAGFDAERILSFKISLRGSGYDAPARRIAFVDALMQRLAGAPGVTRAALTSVIPFGGVRGANGVEIEGRPKTPGESIIIDQRQVTPGYFQTMGIRLLRGRTFTSTDDARSERVVTINRAMAERYWPGQDPIDRRVRVTAGFSAGVWCRIVGVVENVRHIALSREPVPEMYNAYAQAAVPTFTVVMRTTGDPIALAPVAHAAVQAADPTLPLYDVRTMDDRVARSFAQTRATMLLLLATAVLAATLASVAIYGSIWYSVSQRIPEIGIRMALGAGRASVCRGVVGRALLHTGVGAGVGIAIALAASPLLSNLLFETPRTDPATYAGVLGGLFLLTVGASILPARRAMRVDPIVALRHE